MKVSLTRHQEKFVSSKMKGGGYLSEAEVVREALRVYEMVESNDYEPNLEGALREALRSPLKKYKPGQFVALGERTTRRPMAA